jgi:hypothetical protein
MRTNSWEPELMSQETNQDKEGETATLAVSPRVEEILGSLEQMAVQFDRLIAGRSREALQQPGQDGRWGVVEVLCFLRDWEDVIHDRIVQIIGGERPEFDDPDVMMWSLEHDYGAQDAHEVFGQLVALRTALVERLREMDEAAWERTGVMMGRGEVTLEEFLQHVIEHDQRYLVEAREAVA